MKVNDAQLGRIARELRNHNRHTTQTVLIDAIDGRLDDAIETAMYMAGASSTLFTVLRAVADEVDLQERKCRVQVEDKKGVLMVVAVAGDSALDDAGGFYAVASDWTQRITITNEHHNVCWTWERP